MTPQDAIRWFEIPTVDLDRATRFYEHLLEVSLRREVFADEPMSIFPSPAMSAGGALLHRPQMQPSTNGSLVYLNCDSGIDAALARLEASGVGAIVLPKTELPHGIGFIAVVLDSEGNHVGLHQRADAQ